MASMIVACLSFAHRGQESKDILHLLADMSSCANLISSHDHDRLTLILDNKTMVACDSSYPCQLTILSYVSTPILIALSR